MKPQQLLKVLVALAVTALIFGCASAPANNHPNLDKAQEFIEQAIGKVSDAQQANDYDMNGHAAKAKELLQQAVAEVKLARDAANGN